MVGFVGKHPPELLESLAKLSFELDRVLADSSQRIRSQRDRAFPARSLERRKVEQRRREAIPEAALSMIITKREPAVEPWSAFSRGADSEQLAGTRANGLKSAVHVGSGGCGHHFGCDPAVSDPVSAARPEPARLSLGRREEDRR